MTRRSPASPPLHPFAIALVCGSAAVGCAEGCNVDRESSPGVATAATQGPRPARDAAVYPAGLPEAAADAGAPDAAVIPPALPEEDLYPTTLAEQREALFRRMAAMMRLTDAQLSAVRAIFEKSSALGQGNPAVAKYAMTRRECRERRTAAGVVDEDKPACGAPFMAPLFDRSAGETEADARVCIDRYEFPGIPCEHPVVWAIAR
jgi:hypothetical protein